MTHYNNNNNLTLNLEVFLGQKYLDVTTLSKLSIGDFILFDKPPYDHFEMSINTQPLGKCSIQHSDNDKTKAVVKIKKIYKNKNSL